MALNASLRTPQYRDPRRAPDLFLLDGTEATPAAEPDPIRVLIADGQPVVRAGFYAVLDGEPDIQVAGAAATGQDALMLAGAIQPDIALLDLELPGLNGVEVTRALLEDPDGADVRVMILASHDSDEQLFDVLRAGARGFVLKSTEPAELVQAVRVVARGEALLSPSATRRLIAEFAAQPQPRLPTSEQLDELTARESEVLTLVATGMRNDEIAARLVISPATVKTHVSRVLRKLDARDRAQLVTIAYQTGLVHPGTRRPLSSIAAARQLQLAS
jgi:DNA-binding NarL/FixJ family response regulator